MLLRSTLLWLLFSVMASANDHHITKDILSAGGDEIAFASDTQAPLFVEQLMLKDHHNRKATGLIFADIVAHRPRALFLLGDVVSWGSSGLAWRRVTRYLDSCRQNGIPIYATLGNHELMGIKGMKAKAQRTFKRVFPEYRPTGFVELVDSVAVILLNSNFGSLSKQDDSFQQQWFRDELQKLDADPSVEYVIVGCHHSPFTNSKIAGPSKGVQQKFVPAYVQAKKTVLFLSGHAHAFEHFKKEGKDFMVIGGGGGVYQPLSKNARAQDLASGYKPMFHYLTIKRFTDHLLITSHRLTTDKSGFVEGMTINIDRWQQQP